MHRIVFARPTNAHSLFCLCVSLLMMNKYNGGLDGNINGMYLPPTNGAIQMPYVGKAVASPKPDDKIVPYQHSIDEHFNKAPNAELNETADQIGRAHV